MPIEILETMASINYNTPRPHPVDPAVFYDVIKIRKLVEEATDLAVRAASDAPSQMLLNSGGSFGGGGPASSLGLGGPGPGQHGSRLSRERKFRMNLQACQKLARAYRLDEIACSVATMQGASTLDDIGANVLQRNRDEIDGKYVHFFHEKIPSRQLADNTSLQPLNEIIATCPADPEPYRTRAMIRGFMHNFEGAVSDFTKALDIHHLYGRRHQPPAAEPPSPSNQNNGQANGKRAPDVRLSEEEQPTSLIPQLLFMRACAYLTLACDNVRDTVTVTEADFPGIPLSAFLADSRNDGHDEPYPFARTDLTDAEILVSRRMVKTYAKRALKDFLAFLSHLDYTPHMPQEAVNDFTEKIGQAASGTRNPRNHQQHHSGSAHNLTPQVIYSVSDLFAATPPANLPPYPPPDLLPTASLPKTPTNEACTYHPLLTEALHSLLLCHALLQTSRTELIRHANNVARLARLADAYPVFQASRSAARADWVDVVEKTDLSSSFCRSWDVLCSPAPLPSSPPSTELIPSSSSSSAAITTTNGTANPRDHPPFTKHHQQRTLTRWSVTDDGKEYPIVTDRAVLVARWMRDVPFVAAGTAKKKKRKNVPGRKTRGGSGEGDVDGLADIAGVEVV